MPATSTRGSPPRRPASPSPLPRRTPKRASPPSSPSAPRNGAAGRRFGGGRPAGRAPARGSVGRGADRGGRLGPVGDSGLPQPGDRAVGERRPDGGRPHLGLRTRPGAVLALLPAALP